jgi:hypothetical protein
VCERERERERKRKRERDCRNDENLGEKTLKNKYSNGLYLFLIMTTNVFKVLKTND